MTDTSVIERRDVTMSDFRMDESGSGTFSGYANLHGVEDTYKTFMTRSTWQEGGLIDGDSFVLLDMHRRESIRDALGKFSVTNDSKGLRIDGEFANTTAGQDARALAAMGIAPELSVGFVRTDGKRGNEPGEILGARLVEVSLILKNMASQPGAELTGVRSDAYEVMVNAISDEDGERLKARCVTCKRYISKPLCATCGDRSADEETDCRCDSGADDTATQEDEGGNLALRQRLALSIRLKSI